MGELLQELKRRNVFRVGVAYAVVGWLIVQIIETISEPLGLPEWTEAFFIVLVIAGLPLVLIFAWAFEITPEGLKKSREVDKDQSVTADTGKKLNYTIIAVLVLALGYFVYERQGLVERVDEAGQAAEVSGEITSTAAAASVAVLPFVNMSADPEQEYFSDGISEELLNLLAKIPELRVPARTSSFQFKGQNLDIAKVAEELKVAHVLEGSVRKADVRIRVTAQLIEAETGYHLWSDTYDRELTDIFQIQDEISAAIVASLSETLGLKTGAAPKSTSVAANPDAYNAYLMGQHLIQKRNLEDIQLAATNFARAVELEPDYAPAHSGLALATYLQTGGNQTFGTLPLDETLGTALPHAEKALALDPSLAEAQGVMGLLQQARQAHEDAIPYYERALELNPSQTNVRNWYSQALGDLGLVEESFRQMQLAYEYDPLSLLTLNNYTDELYSRRHYDQAEPMLERLGQLDPSRKVVFDALRDSNDGRLADAVTRIFRRVDHDPGNVRLRSRAAFGLISLGLVDEALAVWPNQDNLFPIVSNSDDREYTLQLARQQFEEDPADPANLEDLAWSYWDVGNREQALKMASRYRDELGSTRAKIDGINMLFALDARDRGDKDAVRQFLDPMQENLDNFAASGVQFSYLHFARAMIVDLQGDRESAIQHARKAMDQAGFFMNLNFFDQSYRWLGWDDVAEFDQLRNDFAARRSEQRALFLAAACGTDGFTAWQPSPETCREAKTTDAPPPPI